MQQVLNVPCRARTQLTRQDSGRLPMSRRFAVLRAFPHMSQSLFSLEGEVAVVIGATGVLGGALAEGLAAAGASVAVLGRNTERGEACVGRIVSGKGKADFFPVDAIDPVSLRVAHESVTSAFGPPTVLVNAA